MLYGVDDYAADSDFGVVRGLNERMQHAMVCGFFWGMRGSLLDLTRSRSWPLVGGLRILPWVVEHLEEGR